MMQMEYAAFLLAHKQYENASRVYINILQNNANDFDSKRTIIKNLISTYEKDGEAHKIHERQQELINMYTQFIKNNQSSRKTSMIKYYLGLDYLKFGDTNNAKRVFEDLISSEKDTYRTRNAKQALDRINSQ